MSELWQQHLQQQGAQFDNGRVIGYSKQTNNSAPPAERDATLQLVDLSHFGLIRATGIDAASFLHNQLTNDVNNLAEGHAQWNGWCAVKGRLLMTCALWKSGDSYWLMMPRALVGGTIKRLRMFVLRSKVVLDDMSDELVRFACVGLANTATAVTSPMTVSASNGAMTLQLDSAATVYIATATDAISYWNSKTATAHPTPASAWDLHQIRQGVLTVLPETVEAFVPQMANFELAGGVSFKKGCYPGQEIVARTQYRGILKRRMVRVAISNSPPIAAIALGDKLYSPEFGDQACGEVANFAPTESGDIEALVVAQVASIQGGNLRILAVDGLLASVLTLPYEIPQLLAAVE
jgi:tRNA-modifying protein YgfZ